MSRRSDAARAVWRRSALLLALVFASPALAGQAGRSDAAQANAARRTMRAFATCVVHIAREGHRPRARLVAFLSSSPTSAEGGSAAQDLMIPQCLNHGARVPEWYVEQLRLSPQLLRGQFFRTLYLDQQRSRSVVRIRREEIKAGFALPQADGLAPLQRFGDCVVSGNPAGAAAAIRQDPGSTGETVAYRALSEALSRCVQGGDTLRFSRSVLEGVLAEALYKQANGLPPAAGA